MKKVSLIVVELLAFATVCFAFVVPTAKHRPPIHTGQGNGGQYGDAGTSITAPFTILKRNKLATISGKADSTKAIRQAVGRTFLTRHNTLKGMVTSGANSSGQVDQQADEFSPRNNWPFFPGGPKALQAYLQNPALYPPLIRQAQVEGRVRVRFLVTETGHLTQIRVVQSGGPLLDSACLSLVTNMPRWYPAHREGVPVSCPYELPIAFHLD